MAFSFKRPSSVGSKSKSLGNIALEINSVSEDVDPSKNKITGTNIETGEELTIRLATKEEFARYLVSTRISAPAERQAAAERSIGNRASVSTVTNKSSDGAVVQFDDVRSTPQSGNIARWAGSLTTNSPRFPPETAATISAEITTFQYKDAATQVEKTGTKLTGILKNEAFAGDDPDAIERVRSALEGNVGNLPALKKAGVLVAVTEPGNDNDKFYAVLSTQKDGDRGVITGLDENITRSPVGRFEALAQTALAAVAQINFDDLDSSKSSPDERDWLRGMYDAIQSGDLNISIAPSFEATLMPRVQERLHNAAKNSNGMLDRGFFDANIGIRAGAPRQGRDGDYDANIREVKPSGFLENKNSDSFVRARLGAIASQVVDIVDQSRARRSDPQAENEQSSSNNFGAPDF